MTRKSLFSYLNSRCKVLVHADFSHAAVDEIEELDLEVLFQVERFRENLADFKVYFQNFVSESYGLAGYTSRPGTNLSISDCVSFLNRPSFPTHVLVSQANVQEHLSLSMLMHISLRH